MAVADPDDDALAVSWTSIATGPEIDEAPELFEPEPSTREPDEPETPALRSLLEAFESTEPFAPDVPPALPPETEFDETVPDTETAMVLEPEEENPAKASTKLALALVASSLILVLLIVVVLRWAALALERLAS